MPRQWITAHGVEQSRRSESAMFPPELRFQGVTFTLERDGVHVVLPLEEGAQLQRLFSRGEMASLLDWLTEHEPWFGEDLDPAYEVEPTPQECGYCLRNLSHSKAQHDEVVAEVHERRKQMSAQLNARLFESA